MTIKAFIEMPTNTRYKYELDKLTNQIKLDRVNPIQVPFNYGFIPNTLEEDGDDLDIFVLSSEPLPQGITVNVKPLGIFFCTDNGQPDHKIVAVLEGDTLNTPKLLALEDIIHYLKKYKEGFIVGEFFADDGTIKQAIDDSYTRRRQSRRD